MNKKIQNEFEQPTKIRIESYGGKVITEVETNRSGLNIEQIFELFTRALNGHGYSYEVINNHFNNE